MRSRRVLAASSLTLALLLAGSSSASAHPFIRGGTAPAASLATITLAMAHGCGTEESAGGDPTTEIAVAIPEVFSYVEPHELDGYEVNVEGEGPLPDVVVWTATDGGVPAPEVTMDVVVDGAEGDVIYLQVFQGCDGFQYRWIGTPDEPADDPAVRLTLTAPDPDSPPPVVEPEPTPEPTTEPAPTSTPDEPTPPDTTPDPPATDGAADDDATGATTDGAAGEVPGDTAGTTDGGGGVPWIVAAAVAAALVVAGVVLARRRSADGTGSVR